MHHRLLHLIAGEPTRDENALQQVVCVQSPLTRKSRDQVHVKLVAPIDDGDGVSVRQCVRGHRERKLEKHTVAVEQTGLSRRAGEGLKQALRVCDGGQWLGGRMDERIGHHK